MPDEVHHVPVDVDAPKESAVQVGIAASKALADLRITAAVRVTVVVKYLVLVEVDKTHPLGGGPNDHEFETRLIREFGGQARITGARFVAAAKPAPKADDPPGSWLVENLTPDLRS